MTAVLLAGWLQLRCVGAALGHLLHPSQILHAFPTAPQFESCFLSISTQS